jgi:Glycosyl hydrolases family 16
MVGGLKALRRVAAVGLLALGSVVPHNGPFLTAPTDVTPVADTSLACLLTVGTATTDPALATSAARAIAVGYAATDCMPDEQLLAAAEARAAIPMDTGTPTQSATGGVLAGTSSGSTSVATTSSSAATVTPTSSPSATATAADATVAASSTDTATATGTVGADSSSSSGDGSDDDSNSGNSSSGNSSSGNSSSGNSSSGNSSSGNSSSGSSGSDSDSDDSLDSSTSVDPNPVDPNPVDPAPVDPAPVDPAPVDPAPVDPTAAGAFAWGAAEGVEDFDGTLSNWGVYDGPGHAGKGRRSPAAMNASGGILTITGDPNGTTGGMAWNLGRARYGRWEARVKAPAADPSYHAVMLLWPDAENWPVGGEVDFMEISDAARQKTDFFLHYGQDNRQLRGEKVIDATQWHNWAVEWSPTKITAYVDGTEWFSTTQVDASPPGSMHLTLQLDWFPKGSAAATPSQMLVDWVRYYPITGTGPSDAIQNSPDVPVNAGVALNSIAGAGLGETLPDDTVLQSGSTDPAPANDSSDPTPGTVANAGTTVTTTITAPAKPTAPSPSAASSSPVIPTTLTSGATTSLAGGS